MCLSFIIDNHTGAAVALFERADHAEQVRARLGNHTRFAVEPYRAGGDELTVARLRQIGGTVAAYTFG